MFYDPINKKLGFFKFCPPDMCVQNSGKLFWCMQWVIMTDVAEVQYNCVLPLPIYYIAGYHVIMYVVEVTG